MRNNRYKKASSRIARRDKVKRFFSLFLKISLPTAFLVGLVLLLQADFLQIKNFEILGAETIPAENLKNIARSRTSGKKFGIIPKTNIFLLNKNNLASILLSDFGRIEKVEVNKQFFDQKVEIKITERKGEFIWCSDQNECFSMTKEGLVFERSQLSGDKIIFRGILEANPLMQNFASPAKMQNYLNLIQTLKNGGFDAGVINIESSDKAVAKTKINNVTSDIVFNPEEIDLSKVAQNVILLINEIKSKNSSADFIYIDARFDNKMFYKLY